MTNQAAEVVARRGLDVANVDGGMIAWKAADLPTEAGPETTKED